MTTSYDRKHQYGDLWDLVAATSEGIRPPERLTVSQSAAKYRKLNNAGSYVGPWLNETTPYLVEPMDELTSTNITGLVFVGPAQAGKTDMALNWLTHSVTSDPADMLIVEKSKEEARDFSMRRLDKLQRDTPAVADRVTPGANNTNTFDRKFISGMLLTLGWPTKNTFSGKPIGRLWLSDYDRMDQDIGGDGSPFFLAKQRIKSFGRFGMTVAESSPSFPVEEKSVAKKTKHQAPTTQGILSLYQQGDRRMWYWHCVSCHNAFLPDFNLMQWPDSDDIMECAELAHLVCPTCNAKYYQTETDLPGKHEMNREHARWLKDGQVWLPNKKVEGIGARSDIASFWLKGVCATFADHKALVTNYLNAMKDYEDTGSDKALKTTVNTDQGNAYVPPSMADRRTVEDLKAKAKDTWGVKVVPRGVRFLVATIDLQKNRFVVQVHGVGDSEKGIADIWLIDRFDIKKSRRYDEDGERIWVNIGTHLEDWKQLTDEVMLKTYPLDDGSGRRMGIKMTTSDMAGRKGFTENAYNFVRWLRHGPPKEGEAGYNKEHEETYIWRPDLSARFHLLRGDPNKNAPRVRITYPDSERKDRHAGARGEIPVMHVNGNMMKDSIDKMLDRTEPGGRINFPTWLPDSVYAELTVEIKDPVKGWINPKHYRNETFDLLAYCKATMLMPGIDVENLNPATLPGWAKDWDDNDLVFDPEMDDNSPKQKKTTSRDWADLAKKLA